MISENGDMGKNRRFEVGADMLKSMSDGYRMGNMTRRAVFGNESGRELLKSVKVAELLRV